MRTAPYPQSRLWGESPFVSGGAAAEAAVRLSPREGAFLLLADIEEAETGDQGRVRHWLAKAVRAPRDPAWVADGYVAERWMPASPVTGELDAFEWRVPMERPGQIIDAEEALTALPEGSHRSAEVNAEEAHRPPDEAVSASNARVDEPAAAWETKVPPAPAKDEAASAARDAGEARPHIEEKPVQRITPVIPDGKDEAEEPRPPLPDDPGVEPEEEASTSRNFRLF